jgi:hypothetical protein
MAESRTDLPDLLPDEPADSAALRRRALTTTTIDKTYASDSDSGFDDNVSSAGGLCSLPIAAACSDGEVEPAVAAKAVESLPGGGLVSLSCADSPIAPLEVDGSSSSHQATLQVETPPRPLEEALQGPAPMQAPAPAQRSPCAAAVFSELLQTRQRVRPAAGDGDSPPRPSHRPPQQAPSPAADRSADNETPSSPRREELPMHVPMPDTRNLTPPPLPQTLAPEQQEAAPVPGATSSSHATVRLRAKDGARPGRQSLRTALRHALRKAWT